MLPFLSVDDGTVRARPSETTDVGLVRSTSLSAYRLAVRHVTKTTVPIPTIQSSVSDAFTIITTSFLSRSFSLVFFSLYTFFLPQLNMSKRVWTSIYQSLTVRVFIFSYAHVFCPSDQLREQILRALNFRYATNSKTPIKKKKKNMKREKKEKKKGCDWSHAIEICIT